MRRLVLKLQRGTIVVKLTSEFQRKGQRRGQKRGLKKEVIEVREKVKEEIPTDDGGGQNSEGHTLSVFIVTRRDKKNCPRNKAQYQSSKATTTTMMAMESDVLLEASTNEESDWISDSENAYPLVQRQRGVLCTCSMRRTCTDDKQHNENLLVKEQSGSAWQNGRSMKIGGDAIRYGSSGISKKNGQRKQSLHKGTQSKRMSTRMMYLKDPEQLCTRERGDGVTNNLQSDVLCSVSQWGGAGHLSEKVQALQFESAFTSMGSEVARG
ncbi:hypothetical protein Acr_00g0038980 [Actinidia rufa]|uniref:Uncharacterized protein n=1 Tax=Actinidia rufa TaxID=165716 RepID=A0A7J0DHT1_9ERIC|nr:hypothetical protein Acr_00g0038980 [Actinidia rufa]